MMADDSALLQAAQQARAQAHAPYSRYAVGAAIHTPDGQIFGGCNVESASYGLTICAERVALFSAVAAGARQFDTLAVVSANGGAPCGACRQVLHEFAPGLRILVADATGAVREYALAALLPHPFGPSDLLPPT